MHTGSTTFYIAVGDVVCTIKMSCAVIHEALNWIKIQQNSTTAGLMSFQTTIQIVAKSYIVCRESVTTCTVGRSCLGFFFSRIL